MRKEYPNQDQNRKGRIDSRNPIVWGFLDFDEYFSDERGKDHNNKKGSKKIPIRRHSKPNKGPHQIQKS